MFQVLYIYIYIHTHTYIYVYICAHAHIYFKLINLFWLCWVFVAVCALSLVAASRDYSSLWYTAFSLQWFVL